MGSTIYSPLAGGVLTGKYLNGVEENSRYATGVGTFPKQRIQSLLDPSLTKEKVEALKNLQPIA
jgi:aryl-alcohol dehydrogenase-like predicted oxidoreductase